MTRATVVSFGQSQQEKWPEGRKQSIPWWWIAPLIGAAERTFIAFLVVRVAVASTKGESSLAWVFWLALRIGG